MLGSLTLLVYVAVVGLMVVCGDSSITLYWTLFEFRVTRTVTLLAAMVAQRYVELAAKSSRFSCNTITASMLLLY